MHVNIPGSVPTAKCASCKMSRPIKWKPPTVQAAIFLTAKFPAALCLEQEVSIRRESDCWVGTTVCLITEKGFEHIIGHEQIITFYMLQGEGHSKSLLYSWHKIPYRIFKETIELGVWIVHEHQSFKSTQNSKKKNIFSYNKLFSTEVGTSLVQPFRDLFYCNAVDWIVLRNLGRRFVRRRVVVPWETDHVEVGGHGDTRVLEVWATRDRLRLFPENRDRPFRSS